MFACLGVETQTQAPRPLFAPGQPRSFKASLNKLRPLPALEDWPGAHISEAATFYFQHFQEMLVL
eukprot:965887-Pyramimonas_sp.AAC.1